MYRDIRWPNYPLKISGIFFLLLILNGKNASAVDRPPSLGSFTTTYYFVPTETQYPNSEGDVIKDINGKVLSKVNEDFKKELDVEGSGILRSGHTVNFAKRVENEIRYRFSKPKWGWGVGRCELKPYKSLAVDPDVIPLGTVVFIPAVKGAILPDGKTHDGIFYAEDIGSKILKYHVDLFASDGKASGDFFIKLGLNRGKSIAVYKVKDPDPKGCQTQTPVSADFQSDKSLASSLLNFRKSVNGNGSH